MQRSAAFRQEIMRMEITVTRAGKSPISITNVPRVAKDDVIKLRLLDEPVNGIKPDHSYWDWTLLVAFVNPSRRQTDGKDEKQKSVSEEIRFKKSGWYREYSFAVPYDSQPVFFLYPKPKYRDKILKLVGKNYEEIQKLGEKTIEIAGAYAQIDSFLNELQTVLVRTQVSRYGQFVTYPDSFNNPIPGIGSNPYRPPGYQIAPVYNYNAFLEQTVERLAQSFNIQLPSCWNTQNGNVSGGGYNLYSGQKSFGHAVNSDLIGRAQCVAKNVRLEDFDFSVASMLKQGGIFAATQLRDKYPQLAYWINIAAVALDFIVKAFQKSPLRLVPTIVSTNGNPASNIFSNNFGNASQPSQQNSVKISLFAESQPSENEFVTAYPIIVQKWQSDADPEVISLAPPVPLEPCLHAGVNILKNTDLKEDQSADSFAKDFKLALNGANNYKKEFLLKKNLGLKGWELNLTPEDINQMPKTNASAEAEIVGLRGFNEIKSPKFTVFVFANGNWQIKSESLKSFVVGAKRTISLLNPAGGCRCLQSVTYKPATGAPVVFEANSKQNPLYFSPDDKEVSLEIDGTLLQPGAGQIEVRTYGAQAPVALPIKLYAAPPVISDFKIAEGNREATLTGERLEQIQFIKINGKKAKAVAAQNQNLNQRTFVFEDADVRQTEANVSLELNLEGDRSYQYPKTFVASPPRTETNQSGEIESVMMSKISNKKMSGTLRLNL